MMQGPRVYNLFPLLAGSVRDWEHYLASAAGMGFNWVFLNPFHYPGFSGSLYAVKDYYRLHDLFQGRSRKSPDDLLREFLGQAEEHGLSVMMDLVINHTAKDSVLVEQHPEWFALDEQGQIRSPFAADPDHPDDISKRTVWGDLAEIEYHHSRDPEGLLNYWRDLVRHYTALGFHGFRCDAAYKVPGAVWGEIIRAARQIRPETRFFAETLGCQPPEVIQLHEAGFDYLFNSAKWWDFRAPWLLEQYETYRHIAPSLAFPESHDTERVAAESGGDARWSRLRYLFAVYFSSGVMMPMGYEYGFRRKLHVVETRPEDWEAPLFDLTAFVQAANRMKTEHPALNQEGPQWRFTSQDEPLTGLVRFTGNRSDPVGALINPSREAGHDYALHDLARGMETDPGRLREITPGREAPILHEGSRVHLQPLEMRVFAASES